MPRWSRKRLLWTITVTVLVTVLAMLLSINFAGPEKKIERRVEHHHAVADSQFRREMSVMLGPSIVGGNRAEVLNNGDEIFPPMLLAIAQARRTITFETYIFESDTIGRRFADALMERARAGVEVNVIVDWAGSIKLGERLFSQMRDAGVRIHRYRPLHWYELVRLNNRTHRKTLVVDGRIGFTGGVCVADAWLGHAQDGKHWREMQFRVEGPVVAQLQASFNDNWIKITGKPLDGNHYFPALPQAGDMHAQVIMGSPANGSERMHLMYLMAIAAADKSIDIQTSYFVPDSLSTQALLAARRRGVRIRVLGPGPYTDSQVTRIASKADWKPLLQTGVEFYEYQPSLFHNKLLIVDRELVSVGSPNFDERSLMLNDETSLNVYDRGFAETMTAVFEADLRRAKPYTLVMWQQRPLREKLVERFVVPIKSQL